MRKLNPRPPLPIPENNISDAVRGLQAPDYFKSIVYQEQQRRAERGAAHPDLLVFERKLLAKMAKLDIPMFTHNMVRDADHQNRLYVTGVSKAKAGQSPHNYGLAFDMVHSVKAWDLTKRQWSVIGHVGKELAIQIGVHVKWGGDWTFYDPAHWELENWKALKNGYLERKATEEQLRAASGYDPAAGPRT